MNNLYRIEGMVANFARQEGNNLQFTLGALRELITMMSGLPGEKSILYVSNGLPMVPAIDMYHAMATEFDTPAFITESHTHSQHRQFDSLVAAANSQDITFYTVGAGGLEAKGMGSAEHGTTQDIQSANIGYNNYLDSIKLMADATGGRAIVNTNDVRAGLEMVGKDFYTYYSLGFRLQSAGEDKVHKLTLELPNHPEYQVRYRRRFVEKSLDSRVQDRVVTGLMFDLDENPMGIECVVDTAAPARDNRWMVPFELWFPVPMVAMVPEGDDYVGRVTMFVASRDTKGKQSDVVRQEHEIRIPIASYEEVKDTRFKISAHLLMEKGSYRVAVGLLDRMTRQASYQTLAARVGN
jgi:hypothetical protein